MCQHGRRATVRGDAHGMRFAMQSRVLGPKTLAVAVGLAFASPAVALAQDPEPDATSRLVWNEAWPRFRTAEYVATGTMFAGAIASLVAMPQQQSDWGGIAFDEPLQDAIVLGNRKSRDTARHVGDGFYYGLFAYPVLVDAVLVAMVGDGNPDVGWQMLMIDAQAFAFTGLLSATTQRLVGRPRPFSRHCEADAGYDKGCQDPERYQSFISGHVAIAVTGAGLVCTHNIHLHLYGSHGAAAAACAAGFTGSAVVAMTRLVSDRHYASDVVIGTSVGVISGVLIPELLHYRWGSVTTAEIAGVRGTVVPVAAPNSGGLALTGVF